MLHRNEDKMHSFYNTFFSFFLIKQAYLKNQLIYAEHRSIISGLDFLNLCGVCLKCDV